MAETSPGDVRATERLHEYWVHGEGAAKIRWGEGGDFDRCVLHLGKYVRDPKGYCANAHHAALGIWPATHAAEVKKETGRSSVTVTQRAEMTSASINDLPDSDFAYIEPGGTRDSSGRTVPRDKRHFPLHDADHVRNALSRAPQSPFGDKAMPKIREAAKKFGVDVSDDSSASASRRDDEYGAGFSYAMRLNGRSTLEFSRIYELEDIQIVSRAQGDGTGRLVEAYAAVFNVPAEIHDVHGDYNEENDPGAFNRSIDHASRAARSPFRCIYNHGMTIHGTPAERFSIPIGTPREVRAESRGLLTRTLYNETPLADEVLEAIKTGGITAQSYTGRIIRSTPELRRGERYRPGRDGKLTTVRRMELALREYGPTPFPAFSGADILGVRMSTPGSWSPDPDDQQDPGTSPDGEPAAGDPLSRSDGDEHSARYHQHVLYALRSRERRERAGLTW